MVSKMAGQRDKFARRLGFEGFRTQKVLKTEGKLMILKGVTDIEERPAPPLRQIEALGEPLKVKDLIIYIKNI